MSKTTTRKLHNKYSRTRMYSTPSHVTWKLKGRPNPVGKSTPPGSILVSCLWKTVLHDTLQAAANWVEVAILFIYLLLIFKGYPGRTQVLIEGVSIIWCVVHG